MKFKNKGHEMDDIYLHLSALMRSQKIYLFGAGAFGRRAKHLLENIEIQIKGFIDNDIRLYEIGCEGLPVMPLDAAAPEDSVVIVALSPSNPRREAAICQLSAAGFSAEQQNMLSLDNTVVSILYSYQAHKTYLLACSVSLTQQCSLNCKYCSIFTPDIQHPQHMELQLLKEDADAYFSAVDFTGEFNLLGGEPFLYPYLDEYLSYIGERYRSQIDMLAITTNGTILPRQRTLELMEQYHMRIVLSDYTDALPQLKDRVGRFIENVRCHPGIDLYIFKAEHWIDFGYNHVDHTDWAEGRLIDLFDRCNTSCRLLKDKKLYYCANSRFAQDAGFIHDEDAGNQLDLSHFVRGRDETRFLEFDLGYSEKGYVELCKTCSGYLTINTDRIPVAEQAPRVQKN